jgi:mannose-1-phosphate guanylyltransferase
MHIILLSGGSGKRLWPLSNGIRSKQFLKLLKNENGTYESMIQRVYGQIRKAGIDADIIVAAGSSQKDAIRSQLGDNVELVLEPERRDTFPAIALSCSYLSFVKKVDPDEAILVLPVDPYADMEYFHVLRRMEQAVILNAADLVLMGIVPDCASPAYGYIVPRMQNIDDTDKQLREDLNIHMVEAFCEKPGEETARKLIGRGAVWNGGVFGFRLKYVMDIAVTSMKAAGRECLTYEDVRRSYSFFKKTSFDYEVAEKASSIAMIPYKGCWKDLGTWNILCEEMQDKFLGRVTFGEDTRNTTVINELPLPVIALGLENIVVAASPDGILVSDKAKSLNLKAYVNNVYERPMCYEGTWGRYRVCDYSEYEDSAKALTKHLHIKAGRNTGYSAHKKRDEMWTIVNGTGFMVIDGAVREISRGDVVIVKRGKKHGIRAHEGSDLHYIEVQIGDELTEEDSEEFEWLWS